MKNLIKNNIKFIFGIIVGIVLSSTVIYASQLTFASGDVDHKKADGTITTVQAAINDLYSKSSTPTTVTGNAYSGSAGFLNGSSALTGSTSLTLSNYKSSNKYNFNLGSGEQITFPAGYYNLPINISNGGTSGLSEFTITTFTGGQDISHVGHSMISLSSFKKLYKYVKCTSRSAQYVGWSLTENSISTNVDYEIASHSYIGITTTANSNGYTGHCTFVFHN